MTDYSRMTKAEIIEELKKEQEAKEQLIKEKAAQGKQIELDMSFGSEMTPERKEQLDAQRRKDFIKRMTNGKWCSEEKYNEYIQEQNRRMRGVS